jgi:transcriptional regulator with XRE-family HTH domain
MATWNEQLRNLRLSRETTRDDLARATGISIESIRSYEVGRRRPTRQHLSHLLKVLGADLRARNLIVADAGFAPETPVGRYAEPNVPEKEAIRLIRARSWPAFLLNAKAEILAVSGAAQRLLGLSDRALLKRRSILTASTRRAIAAQVVNWDEQVAGMIGLFKAGVPEEPSLDAPGPYLKAILNQLTAGDAALTKRFSELWEMTPAYQGRLTGRAYRCLWKASGGTIDFSCHVGCLNTETGLYAHTWIPADAKSHLVLERLLAD